MTTTRKTAPQISQEITSRVEEILAKMTIREKIGQLNQVFSGRKIDERNLEDYIEPIRAGEIGSFVWAKLSPSDRNRLQREAVENSRLGIPLIFGMDIIHGSRTTFPISLGLSCAFDPNLFEKAQTVASREASAEGIDWIFTPMCDIARDPRWGRVAETCGEDPYLSTLCNAAQVRGLQGEDPAAPDRVAACLKHYVGYGASTGGRDYNDTEITEWTLRNAHLPQFHECVSDGALTVMSSFNAIGGIPAVANRHTLTEILRDEWRFPGFVVSDWGAVRETINWGYAADAAEASRLSITAGNDMDMLTEHYIKTLEGEVDAGRVPIAVVDEAVRRVLRVKIRVGLLDRPYVDEAAYEAACMHEADLKLARKCVSRSVVMLRNDGILPLSPELKNVALIGPFGDDALEMHGCWSERGRPEDVVTLAKGLRDALGEKAELSVVKGCAINTTPKTKTLQDGKIVADESAPPEDADLQIEAAVAAARSAELVIMAVGEPCGMTGENASRAYLNLTGNQQALFDAVVETGTPIVTIVFSGRPLCLPEVWKKSSAVLYAWQPGVQAGNGLADLLTGAVSPTGRLSMSVPADVGQVPIFYNQYRTGRPNSGQYRDASLRDPAFWFGFGLTYSRFEYGKVDIVSDGNSTPAQAVITIKNIGDCEAKEVAQLYVRQLACKEGARPRQELRGFQRVTLNPGEETQVRFELTDEVLGYVSRQGESYTDNGGYHIWIMPHAGRGDLGESGALYQHSREVAGS